MFTIRGGQLQRNGQPFFSVGFNYHPSPTGCQYWQQWDPGRLDQDLQQMAQRGFNTVRFFVFWAEFEPTPGQYDLEKISRLQEFVAIAGRHQLQCLPSLLTIWMNGQLFDLPWRQGRDLWTDPSLVACELAYVEHIARTLCHADNILAYDLGDEVIHVDLARSQHLSGNQVEKWLQSLAAAIRRGHPTALVLQANEASVIVGDHPFRPENSQTLDLLALHGYPVWSPFAIESISSYKASCYVPFLVKLGRMYGPVLVDELGSYGGDEDISRNYLRATAYSALANGAGGVLAWCWQDFATKSKPYARHPGERFVGLLDEQGHPKLAMTAFQAFAQAASRDWSGLTAAPAPIGVYLPGLEAESASSYLRANLSVAPAAFYTFLLLKRAHLPFEFTRGPLTRYQLVICPSVHSITLDEQEMLLDYVARGGTVYYSTNNYLHGFGGESLFGIRLLDFTLRNEDMASFCWRGQNYSVLWSGRGEAPTQIPLVRATTAEVLARYPNGSPAFTRQVYGQGTAYYLNAPFEHQLNVPFRLECAPWHSVYDYVAQAAGIQREIDVDVPEVELVALSGDQHRYGFIINHAPETVQVTCRYSIAEKSFLTESMTLEGKGVQVLTWEVVQQP